MRLSHVAAAPPGQDTELQVGMGIFWVRTGAEAHKGLSLSPAWPCTEVV